MSHFKRRIFPFLYAAMSISIVSISILLVKPKSEKSVHSSHATNTTGTTISTHSSQQPIGYTPGSESLEQYQSKFIIEHTKTKAPVTATTYQPLERLMPQR